MHTVKIEHDRNLSWPPAPCLLSKLLHIIQFLVVYQELITNFVLALVAVAVLSMFILGKIVIVALVCLTVVRRHVFECISGAGGLVVQDIFYLGLTLVPPVFPHLLPLLLLLFSFLSLELYAEVLDHDVTAAFLAYVLVEIKVSTVLLFALEDIFLFVCGITSIECLW